MKLLLAAESEFLRGKWNCFLTWPNSFRGKRNWGTISILQHTWTHVHSTISYYCLVYSLSIIMLINISLDLLFLPSGNIFVNWFHLSGCIIPTGQVAYHSMMKETAKTYRVHLHSPLSCSWDTFGLSVIIWRIFLNGHFSTIKTQNS